MNLDVGHRDDSLDFAEPIPDQDLDWTWPAADTFTDDSIARRTYQTCSELGSQRIRLIKIRPGHVREMIECDTKICFLPDAGEYTALSYTWDSPVTRYRIIVDEEPLQVTVNLWRFLWQARKLPARYSGWLWIDALSIIQSDPWEKLEQVGIISNIFEGAKSTVVWLGRAYEDSDKAMKALKVKYSSLSSRPSRALWSPPLGPAILRICERPYWQRLWVLQELKHSREVELMCGDRHLNFECLKGLLSTDSFHERVKAKLTALQNSSAAKMASSIHVSVKTSLRNMLSETNHLRCTDPRDKVYAILNVVGSGSQGIEADYTATLPDLVNHILRNMHASRKPVVLHEVAKQCKSLESLFGMSSDSMFKDEGDASVACRDALTKIDVLSHNEDWRAEMELIWRDMQTWCKHHGHHVVAQMIRQMIPKD
jgi:hypothetical protein